MMGGEWSEVNETNYGTQCLAGQALVLRPKLSFRIYIELGIVIQYHSTFSWNLLPFNRTHYYHNGFKLDLLTFSSQQPHVYEIRHAILHPSDGPQVVKLQKVWGKGSHVERSSVVHRDSGATEVRRCMTLLRLWRELETHPISDLQATKPESNSASSAPDY